MTCTDHLFILGVGASFIRWAWSETNLALIHNGLVRLPGHEAFRETAFSTAWASRSVVGNFDLQESTAYTHLFAVPPPPPSSPLLTGNNDAASVRDASSDMGAVASFVLLFDRLAHGWVGPPVRDLREDFVFAMSFQLRAAQADNI